MRAIRFPTKQSVSTLADPEQLLDANLLLDLNDRTISRALNALVLSACFGYAVFTILNIDHGMTRGWSASEIVTRLPLDNWSSYESALLEKPVMTKTVINVIIYLLGDWLSQTAFSGKNVLDFDLQRTLKNGLIGLCFGPLVHQYYEFSDQILPVEGGLMNRAEKILMDQTIYLTVKCSIYISAVSLLGGESWETTQQTVKDRIGPVVLTAWKFWPLIHCITYTLVPARHRILWVNCVDLVWNAILASKAREPEEESEKEEEGDLVGETSLEALPLNAATVGAEETRPLPKSEPVNVPTYEMTVEVVDSFQSSNARNTTLREEFAAA